MGRYSIHRYLLPTALIVLVALPVSAGDPELEFRTIETEHFYIHYHRNLRQGIDNHLRSIAENQRNTMDLFLQERVTNIRSLFQPDGIAPDISCPAGWEPGKPTLKVGPDLAGKVWKIWKTNESLLWKFFAPLLQVCSLPKRGTWQ